jgi:radical SAM protein
MPFAHPLELSHDEGLELLDQIAAFGQPTPHLVLTGGDPLQRAHLFEIIAYARTKGIRVSITPAATQALTRDVMFSLKEAGVDSMALSLDGATPESHDSIRQVPGCFEVTMRAARWAGEAEISLQINTLVAQETAHELAAVYELLHRFPVMRWSLFFLIAVGRGRQLNELTPEDGEKLMDWTYDLSKEAPFQIKTTEAPSYRRVAQNRMQRAGMTPEEIRATSVHRGYGIRDGNGIAFVSHIGEVFPSGFLPVNAGNVRDRPLAEIYRSSEVFRTVRDVGSFSGKCGECEYRKICGGSRARAFAHSGDIAGSDPFCPYQPEHAGELTHAV